MGGDLMRGGVGVGGFAAASQVKFDEMEYNNCYDCARKGGYMCNVQNPQNPWEHACCPKGSKEEACIQTSTVACSEKIENG